MSLLDMPLPAGYHKPIRKRTGRTGGGPPKLNPDIVREVRASYAEGRENTSQIANRLNVGQSTIVKIVNRKSWRNVE